MTPLALALEEDDPTIAGLLRARGAAEDAAVALVEDNLGALGTRLDRSGDPSLAQALLFAAVSAGRTAAIDLLVGRGADPNARIVQLVGEVPAEVTPLHIAARKGQAATVSALIAAGALPDAGSEEQLPTALHLAAGDGRSEVVRVLLDAGARAGVEERLFGSTPAGWAAHGGHDDLAALLRDVAGE
jgi:ankyrin repeat protein